MSSRQQVLSLYREFFRLYRQWPPELQRSQRFRNHFLSKIRNEFHSNAKLSLNDGKYANQSELDAHIQELIQQGRRELNALKALLNNEIAQEIPLHKDGPIITHLPPEERFMLLDVDVQSQLDKKDQWGYLYKDFKKNWFGSSER